MSRPSRYLAVLAALIIVMLVSIIGGAFLHPGSWHAKFKVGLGLDLSSGTTVTLLAVAPNNHTPTQTEMNQAIAILISRLNGTGTTGATIVQMGTSDITVSMPHKSAEQVAPLLRSALLRFRQVLLEAPGIPVPLATVPTPTPSASGSASPAKTGKPSPSSSTHPRATPSPTTSASASPSPTASASHTAATRAAGHTAGTAAARLGAGHEAAMASSSASPKPSTSGSATPRSSHTPRSSPSPSPTPTPTQSFVTRLPTVADAQGDASMITSSAVIREFNRLNCTNKNWQQQIYGTNPNNWNNPKAQIVACDNQGRKYVLDVAKVLGRNLTGVNAVLNNTNQWVVSFTLDNAGQVAFGNLTTQMYTKYFNPATQQQTSVLDEFAIVLDGNVVSAPQVIVPITAGSGDITGGGASGFTQGQATSLANVLKYGESPLAFVPQSTSSISAQLGSAQLTAGLVAAMVGLLLVVVYSLLYYRGLALVSVFSLATSALLTYLSVVLLSRYQNYSLSLAGVAGLIVAIGITADSFVVFFERLRDEVREGRSLRAAVERGWQRARRTILVSDTVSFLAAALLYLFAIGDVRGFAFTLGLTTIIDIVVVFLFTKPMVTLLARTKFYGQGHRLSGLDPARLGAKSPWRGSRPVTARPATGGAATATSAQAARIAPKEA